MSLVRVEDLTEPPVIGETYLVPCVWGTPNKRNDPDLYKWYPIIGPRHSDAEYIKFEPLHFHFDHQFMADADRDSLGGIFGPEEPLVYVLANYDQDTGIVHWPLVCLRHIKKYPSLSFSKALNEAYEDKTVTCGKCPHRGLPLGCLPREPGTNIVTCPGHGLRWDLTTGKLVHPSKRSDHAQTP